MVFVGGAANDEPAPGADARGVEAAAATAEGPGAAAPAPAAACASRGAGARCGDGAALLDEQAAAVWRGAVCPSWEVVVVEAGGGGVEPARYGAGRALRRSFVAKSFAAALAWINMAAATAERENHHPDLHLTEYRTVMVQIRTIDAGGLTATDFRLAQLLDALPADYSPKWLKQSYALLPGLRAGLAAKDEDANTPATAPAPAPGHA
jgi:pterin-4a-carbinolamine dehydratase